MRARGTAGAGVRAVAADWSGAAHGEQRHLWLAECAPGRPLVTRLSGLTRTAAADRLLDLACADPNLIVGLDFGFSLPGWYLAEAGISAAAELWADPARLEGWLASCPAPFWGRRGRPRPSLDPDRHWRRTELATAPRPKSVFQIGGAGAVGTASLRGMPVLNRLRRAGFAIWPMDRPTLPLVLEVWPRHHIGAVVKSRPAARREWLAVRGRSVAPALRPVVEASEDAFDATASALALGAAIPAIMALAPVDDPLARLEGWIWGVPFATASGETSGHGIGQSRRAIASGPGVGR